MKKIKTKSGDIICVEENTDSIAAIQLLLSYRDEEFKISKLSELTDKDCEEFINWLSKNIYPNTTFYQNYSKISERPISSAKESFISLLQLEGIDTNKEHLIIKILWN